MIKTGFFNSINDDRTYKAEMFAEYFSSFIGNGIFPNPSTNLQVLADSGMNIIIKPGKAWINGYYVHNDSDYTIKLDVADGVLRRIDRVVCRLSMIDREIQILVKKGTTSRAPSPPQLIRDVEYYELALADIMVNNGATQITQANITDTRLNNALCGVVHGTVNQVDTTTIFNQYASWFDEFSVDKEQEIQQFIDDLNALLDGDVASNLLGRLVTLENEFNTHKGEMAQQIEVIENEIEELNIPNYATCSTAASTTAKTATLVKFNLTTGIPISIKFTNANTATAPTLNISGKGAKPLKNQDGTNFIDWVAGGVYSFIYDGSNFIVQGKGGGKAIKSVQHIEVTFNDTSTINQTISTVNKDKCVVYVSEISSFSGESNQIRLDIHKISAKLTSNTNLEVSRGFSGSAAPAKATITIIEYEKIKSIQSGSIVFNNTQTIDISSVDLTKSILVFNFKSDTGGNYGFFLMGKFKNSSQLEFINNITNTNVNYTVNWYVVEFD